ncbi:MAG: hypothetical protein FWF35_00360 [Elusimicrobia bacterium]|nr:hypothetical protein [Elusimicrobiota bacterium]
MKKITVAIIMSLFCLTFLNAQPDNKKSADEYFNKAQIYLTGQDYVNALNAVDKAIELNPDGDFRYYNIKAMLLMFLDKKDEALKELDYGVKHFPKDKVSALVLRSELYSERGHYKESWADIKEIEKINKEVYYQAVISYYTSKQEYKKALKEAKNFYKEYPSVLSSCGVPTLYLVIGDYKKALKATNTMLEKYPGQPSLYMLRSAIYEQMKDYPDAFMDSQRLYPLGIDAVAIDNAYLRYKLGAKDTAFNMLDTMEANLADKTGTSAALIYQVKTELYIEEGDLDKAVECLRKYMAVEKIYKDSPDNIKDLKGKLKKYKGDSRADEILSALNKAQYKFPVPDGATIIQMANKFY